MFLLLLWGKGNHKPQSTAQCLMWDCGQSGDPQDSVAAQGEWENACDCSDDAVYVVSRAGIRLKSNRLQK